MSSDWGVFSDAWLTIAKTANTTIEAASEWGTDLESAVDAAADYVKEEGQEAVANAQEAVEDLSEEAIEAIKNLKVGNAKAVATAFEAALVKAGADALDDLLTLAQRLIASEGKDLTEKDFQGEVLDYLQKDLAPLFQSTFDSFEEEFEEPHSFTAGIAAEAAFGLGAGAAAGFALPLNPPDSESTDLLGVVSAGGSIGIQKGVSAQFVLGIWKAPPEELAGPFISYSIDGLSAKGFGAEVVVNPTQLENQWGVVGIVLAYGKGATFPVEVTLKAGYTFLIPDSPAWKRVDAICRYWEYHDKKEPEKFYLFHGKDYLRGSFGKPPDKLKPPYPRSIADYWSGWPKGWEPPVDAAIFDNSGSFFVFKGDSYSVHEWEKPGSVYPIKSVFGWPESSWGDGDVDAVLVYENYLYFFKGTEYYVYDNSTETASKIMNIGSLAAWPGGWGPGGLDAAVYRPDHPGSDAAVYLFKGSYYSRSAAPDQPPLKGYPIKIEGNWAPWPRD